MYKLLIRGSEGSEVILLQKQLVEEGFLKDHIDGVFGHKTTEALRKKTKRDWIVVDLHTDYIKGLLSDEVHFQALKRLTTPLEWQKGNFIDSEVLGPFKPLLYSNKQILDHKDGRFSWCAAWVHYCTKQVSYPFPMRPKGHWGTFASVRAWKHAAELCNAYKEYHEAKPGDLVVFNWDNDSSDDHIGIFHEQRKDPESLVCLEGNASNAEAARIRQWTQVSKVIDINKLLANVSTYA